MSKNTFKLSLIKRCLALGIFFSASASFAQTVTSLCPPSTNTYSVGGWDGINGLWSIVSGSGTFSNPYRRHTTITNIGFGYNEFLFDYDWFMGDETYVVYNYIANAGRDTTLCSSVSAYQLNGCNPALLTGSSGVWTCSSNCTGITFSNSTSYNSTVSGLTPGKTYVLRWTITLPSPLPYGACTAKTYDEVTITVSAAPFVSAGADQTICTGGTAKLTASGGVSYYWSTGQTGASINVSPTVNTTYSVTIVDAQDCSASDDVQVLIDQLALYSVSSSATTYCSGSSGVSITLSGSESGVNYQLLKNGSADGTALAGTGSSLTWPNKTAGTYTVQATKAATGCTKTMTGSATITQNSLPTQYSLPASASYCSNTSGTTVTLSGSENGTNFQYQLYKNGSAEGSAITGTGSALSWANKTAGVYTVITTNTITGCTQTMSGSTTVTQLTAPTAYNVTGTGNYCQSSGGSTVSLSGSENNVNYQLKKDGLAFGAVKAGNGSALTWTGQTTGTYTIQATNATNACFVSMNNSAVISEVPLPSIFVLSGPTSYCAGASGVTLTLSGSQTGMSYSLLKNGTVISTMSGTNSALAWTEMKAGTYTVQASTTTPISCPVTMSGSVVVTENPLPTANAGADVSICQGKSSQLNATGGLTYSWAPTTGLDNYSVSNPKATPTSTTVYTLTVTDANGCSSSDQIQITVLANPEVVLSHNATICNGKTAILTATDNISGSKTYQWNTGATGNSISVQPSTSTRYFVTLTDGNGCTDTTSSYVTVHPVPVVNAGTDIQVCQGTSVTLTGSGNADNWEWSTGATTQSINFIPSASSDYILRGSFTATGCYTEDLVNVAVNNLPTVYNVAGTGNYCQTSGGLTVTLSGSENNINYQLLKNGVAFGSAKAGTGSALTWPAQTSGTYTVLASNATTGCSVYMSNNAVIGEVAQPSVFVLTGGTSYCAGTPGVTLSLSGSQVGISYSLSKNGTIISTVPGTGTALTWTEMTDGTYTVQATTTTPISCPISMSGSITVTENALPLANAGADISICKGKSSQLNASGGLIYSWTPASGLDNANISNPKASPSSTTTYILTVADANGCNSSDQIQVTVFANPDVILSPNTSICYGKTTVLTATDNITGSKTYVWNTGATSNSISVQPTTSTRYLVTLTDGNGCADTASAYVTVNPVPGVNAGTDMQICKGNSVTLTGTGNADSWEWNTGATSPSITITPSASADYLLRGTISATGCYTDDIVHVTVNNLPTVSFTLNGGTETQYCSNGALISLAGTPLGGTFTSTATGAISGTSFDPSVAGVGSYVIKYSYTDANSCSNSTVRTVNVVAPPSVTITGLNATYCSSASNLVITGAPLQDGNGNYGTWSFTGNSSALIDNSNGTATFKPSVLTTSGVFTVTYQVSNSAGCNSSASQNVTVNAVPTANYIGLPTDICQNGTPVTLSGNQGTSGTFSGSGITDHGNGTATFNPTSLPAGNYNITFTYQDPVTLCQSTSVKTVTVKAIPTAFALTGGGSYCEGGSGVAVGLTNSTNGVNYELFLDGTTTGQIVSGTGTALSFGNQTAPGTYTATATNVLTSCVVNINGSSSIIKNLIPLDAQNISGTTLVCPESSQTYTVAAIANASTYVWTLPANASISSGNGTNTITVLFGANAASGNISVYGQNSCGNGAAASLAIVVKPLPASAATITGSNAVCQKQSNVVYSIPSLANATSYTWTVPSGATIISGQGTSQIIVDYGASAVSGNIKVYGSNTCGNGSITTLSVNAGASPQLTLNAPSGLITCSNTSVIVSASSSSASPVFSWVATNGGNIISGENTSSATVSSAGNYTVTVTSNSCSTSGSISVISDFLAPENINVTSTNSGIITCSTAQVTLSASTTSAYPVGYYWTPSSGGNIVSGVNTATPVVDKAGVYEVAVKNLSTGCSSTKSISITEQKILPNITVVDPETEKLSCTVKSVTLNGGSSTSNVSYNWTGPGIVSGANTETPVVNAAGTYTFTVTGANGCLSVATVQVVTDNTLPNVTINTNPANLTCTASTVTLNGSSTTSGATLLWSGLGIVSGATSQTPIVNMAGTYTLTVTHPISGCTDSKNVTVVQNTTVPAVNFPVLPATITCTTPNVSIQGTTSATNKTYQWTTADGSIVSGASTADVVVSKSGTYTLKITDTDNGCLGSNSIIVSSNSDIPDAQIAAPGILTCTQPSILLSGSSTTNPVNVNWGTTDGTIVSGATSFTPSVSKSGTYVMTITNATNGCSASASVLVSENKVNPVISIDKTPPVLSCYYKQILLNGTATNASLVWTGPAGSSIVDPSSSTPLVNKVGRYYLTATGTNGCTTKDSTDVSGDYAQPLNVQINTPGTLTCTETSILLTGSSTTSGAMYQWYGLNGGNIVSASNAGTVTINAAGDYKLVTIHPSSFCRDSATVSVAQNLATPVISFPTIPNTITCAVTNSQLNSNVTPATSALLWTGPGVISDPTAANPTVSAAGTYTLQATHPVSGCKTSSSIVVSENKTLPDITFATPLEITCTNSTTLLEATTSVSSYTAAWTTSNGTFAGATNLIDVVASKAGLYTLTLTNTANGCSTSKNILATANQTLPNIIVDTNPSQLTCTTTQVELYGTSATTGATLHWTGPGNITDPNAERPKVDAVGTYTLTVTGTNGCTTSSTVSVTEDKTTPAIPTIVTPAPLTCSVTTVNLEVSPLPSNVDYLWTTAGTGNISNGTTAIATVDAIGTYTVRVTNRTSGCYRQNSVTVSENKALPTAIITGDPYEISCTQKTLQLNGNSSIGINPVWTASAGGHIISGANTLLPTIDAAGIYTLSVANASTGCTHSASVTVTKAANLPGLTVDAFPATLTCSVTQVTLSGQPTENGTSYTWAASPGHIVSGADSYNPVVDQPGTYILSVTQTSTGCLNTAAIEVKQDIMSPQISIGTPENITCTRTEVELNASSSNTNVSYAWTTSGTGSIKTGDENAHNPIVYTPATYTVTLTDLTNQCKSVQNVVVSENKTVPNINVNKNPGQLTCITKQILLSGNSLTANATYLWSGPGNISNPASKSPSVDTIGTYTLTVTDPENGCTSSDNVTVSSDLANPDIWVDTNPAILNCTTSTVQLKGSSTTTSVTYLWTGPGNFSDATLKEPYVDAAGTYQLTVTSSVNGCNSSLPVTITQNKTLPSAPLVSGASVCYGAAAATLSATGSSIQWYNNAALGIANRVQTGSTYTPSSVTAVGDYYFYATQTNAVSQCEGPSTQVTYSVKALPNAPVTISNSICEGFTNPTLQASGTSIKWYNTGGLLLASGNQYTPASTISSAGTYTFFASQTDALGCESPKQSATFTIHPTPVKPSVDKLTASTCYGIANPTFNATGTNPKWYASPALPAPVKSGSAFQPLETSTGTYNYYVTQTSTYGCVSPYETVSLTINPLNQVFTVTGGGIYCNGQTGVSVGLSGSQINTAYQLLLNGATVITSYNGTGSPIDFGLQTSAGNYSVVATDANGCTSNMSGGVSILTQPLPGKALTVTGMSTVCEGAKGVTYSILPVANASSYVWNIPAGATISSGLNSNTITIDYGIGSTSGNINVYALNSCGTGSPSANLQVIVSKLPEAASNIKFIGKNNSICLGDTGVIYEVDPIANASSYEWTLPVGASITSGANSRQIRVRFASNSVQGSAFVKVRGVNSCGYGAYSANYAVTIYPNPSVYAGIDQNICSSQTTLQGSATPSGGSGIWQLVSGSATITNNTANTSTLTSIAQGDNKLTWTITENGCSTIDTVKITNNQVNVDAGTNQAICSTEVILSGSALPSGTTGIWTIAYGSAAFAAASQPNTKALDFGYGDTKLYWTVSKKGCNSKDSVIITNYSPSKPDAGPDQTICTNSTWLAASQPVYGTGQWFVHSGALTFANSLLSNTQISSIASGKNVLIWKVSNQTCSLADTVVIWNNSNNVNAGYDQTICDNRTTLDGTAPATGATGQWSVLYGSASFLDSKTYNTKVSGLASGTNKLIWTISKGSCSNSDTVLLISNLPTLANAGADQEIPSSSTTLDGNEPIIGSGKWSIISGSAVFTNDTLYNSDISGLNSGINIFRWSITYKGCTTFDDVQITNGTLETIDAGQNQTICSSETQLEASMPLYGFGIWSVQKGSARFEDNEQYNTKVFDLMPGENILRWSVSLSGVTFYDTVIIVNNKPTMAIVGPAQSLCVDSSTLTGNLPIEGTGKWTLEGGSANINNILNNNSKVNKLGIGTNVFRWTINKAGCVSYALLSISNNNPTEAYAGPDQTICDNKVTLLANNPSVGTGEWSVLSGSGSFSNNQVSGLAPGDNKLRWTITNYNCSSYDDVVITSYKPTSSNAGNDMIICTDSLVLSANKANTLIGEKGHWSVMNGAGIIVDTTLNTSLVKSLAQGVNILRWTIDNHGCTSNDNVEINYAFVKANAGLDVTTCDNALQMNANNPSVGIGEWSIIGGSGTALFVNSNSPNSEVKNLDKGTNTLRWTIRNYTCTSTDEVNVINNSPSTSFAGGDQNLCGNSTILTATSPLIGKGTWSVLSGAGAFNNTELAITTVSNVGTGTNTYRWTISNNNCTSSDEVVISNNSPVNIFAGTDQTLCADSTTLNASQPLIGTGVWSIVSGAGLVLNPSSPFSSIQKLATDTNIIRWTVSNKSCSESKDVKIINNSPTTANAGADNTVCAGSVILDGNVPTHGTGEWSIVSGAGTFINKANFNTQVSGMLNGANTFSWTIRKQNCTTHDEVTFINDLPSQPNAGTDIAVCDTIASLNGNKPAIGTGSWSVLSGQASFEDASKYNTQVYNLGQGSNILVWTTQHNRCKLSDQVEVKNNLTNVYAGPDQIVYTNSAMLAGSQTTRGQASWMLSAGAGTIGQPENFQTQVTGLAEGINTFAWIVDIDGCISSDQVQITYYMLPSATFAVSADKGCLPLEVKFSRTSADSYSYLWSFGENKQTSTDENPSYLYNSPGTYKASLTVTGPDGKQVTQEHTIEVYSLPEVKFDIVSPEVYIPDEALRCYNYSVDGYSYKWNFGDGTFSTDQNAAHIYTDTGYFTVGLVVWTKNQCADSLFKTDAVHVIETSNLKFPTAFTPNREGPTGGAYNRNDYTNDIFYPIVIKGDIEDYKMEIYSRWGIMLFESRDINIGWDGYYNGKLMIEGVYVYRVSGRYNSGKKFSITGDFLLLKNY
jgi:gliding motility-associated-like protein